MKKINFIISCKSCVIDFIKTHYSFHVAEEDSEIMVFSVLDLKDEIVSQRNQCEKLMISGENLHYFQRCQIPVVYKLCCKITNFLNLIKCAFIGRYIIRAYDIFFIKSYYNSFKSGKSKLEINYILSLSSNKYLDKIKNSKDKFAIITNDFKNDNFLNFPYFLDSHFNKLEEFITIKENKLYTEKKHFCAFIVKDNSQNLLRTEFCKQLSKYKEVHCYGKVLNNKSIPKYLVEKYLDKKVDLTDQQFKEVSDRRILDENNYLDYNGLNQELFRDYKFVICFENSVSNDYLTEKLPNVMLANSIGIYRGAPNVADYFNTKSFINFDDYGDFETMINRVIELDQDDEKYQAMLDQPFFKNNKIPDSIKNKEGELKSFLDKLFNDEA